MQMVHDAAERPLGQARPGGTPVVGTRGTPLDRQPQRHAILIHCDRVVADALEKRLAQLGYSSVVRACSEDQASAEARRRRPDLVMVGDTVDEHPGILTALRLRQRHGVPVVLVPPASPRGRRQSNGDIAAAIREAIRAESALLADHEAQV